MIEKRIEQLALIFAQDENGIIGKNNGIPWKSPHDFRWFRQETMGCRVIMGRKTWESLPDAARPLFNRVNYVISSNAEYNAEGAIVKTSLQAAIDDCRQKNKVRMIFVIGGRSLLEQASSLASRAFVSRIGIKTLVDNTCVMAPLLPEHYVEEVKTLFSGDEVFPSVSVDVLNFTTESTSLT